MENHKLRLYGPQKQKVTYPVAREQQKSARVSQVNCLRSRSSTEPLCFKVLCSRTTSQVSHGEAGAGGAFKKTARMKQPNNLESDKWDPNRSAKDAIAAQCTPSIAAAKCFSSKRNQRQRIIMVSEIKTGSNSLAAHHAAHEHQTAL